MSKLTKLIKHPVAFFQDAATNRSNKGKDVVAHISTTNKPKPTPITEKKTVSKVEKKANTEKESTTKKKDEKKMTTPAVTVLTDSINPFKRIAHVIHTGEGMTHGPSHLTQWIPYFSQSGENFVVLVRNMDLYKWVRENYSFVDVIYAKNPINVEAVLNNLPFVKAIYYLSNTGNLIHTLRFNIYQHIFLGHGDSDKSASAHKFFRVYDQIWVAGQAHIDRFKNAGFSTAHMQFIKVGRPMLANIVKQTQTKWSERSILRVLYLPTWEGVYEEGNYSSIRLSSTMLTEIHKKFGCHISAKLHPVTGSRDKMLADSNKNLNEQMNKANASFYLAEKSVPVSELIIQSNVYICDISAVVSECIAANGPLFVYIPKDKEIKISQSDMSYEDYAYTFSDVEELLALMEDVIINQNDYKSEMRLKAMDYLMTVNATMNDEFSNQLRALSNPNDLIDNKREVVIQ